MLTNRVKKSLPAVILINPIMMKWFYILLYFLSILLFFTTASVLMIFAFDYEGYTFGTEVYGFLYTSAYHYIAVTVLNLLSAVFTLIFLYMRQLKIAILLTVTFLFLWNINTVMDLLLFN